MEKIETFGRNTPKYVASLAHARSCGEALQVATNKNTYANDQVEDARIHGLIHEISILVPDVSKDIEETFRNAATANGENVGIIDASLEAERKIQQALRERDQKISRIEQTRIPIDERPRRFRNDFRINVDYIEECLRALYEIVSDSDALDRQWIEVVARLEQVPPVLRDALEWMDTR